MNLGHLLPSGGEADFLVGASHLSPTCHSDLPGLCVLHLAFVNTAEQTEETQRWREGSKGGLKTRQAGEGTGSGLLEKKLEGGRPP